MNLAVPLMTKLPDRFLLFSRDFCWMSKCRAKVLKSLDAFSRFYISMRSLLPDLFSTMSAQELDVHRKEKCIKVNIASGLCIRTQSTNDWNVKTESEVKSVP